MARETETTSGVRTITDDNGTDLATSLSLPVGFHMSSTSTRLELECKLRGKSAWFLLLFALFWNTFLVVWWYISITQRQWGMLLFSVLHVLAGIAVGYGALNQMFGRLRVIIENSTMTIKSIPFGIGTQTLKVADIQQLSVFDDRSLVVNGESVAQYGVKLRLRDGKEIHVVAGLPERAMAVDLERKIERHLGIVDEVQGHRAPTKASAPAPR